MMDYKSAGLTQNDLKEMYKWMDLGRKLDERMWLLNRAGKIPFVISCQGQEAAQIGMAFAMEKGDVSAPYYRDLALITYLGITPTETMMSAFGKKVISTQEVNKCLHTIVKNLLVSYHKVHQ